jgi:hypothetical protein
LFDTAPAQCSGLNAQIQQLQASLAHDGGNSDLGGNTAVRQQLVASYNAYCRGQARGTQLFGFLNNFSALSRPIPILSNRPNSKSSARPAVRILRTHGGSQAVCVRECDGGFSPSTSLWRIATRIS